MAMAWQSFHTRTSVDSGWCGIASAIGAGGAARVSLDANRPKPAAIRPAKISMNHALRNFAP
jgi:hypothetical protein